MITLSGQYSSDDDPPIYIKRDRFKSLERALIVAILDSNIDTVLYQRGDYSFTYTDDDLRELRYIYPDRAGKFKERWVFELRRIQAIESGYF